jgi:hypothetical protein
MASNSLHRMPPKRDGFFRRDRHPADEKRGFHHVEVQPVQTASFKQAGNMRVPDTSRATDC